MNTLSAAWGRLHDAPHRAYFSAATLATLLLAAWWLIALPQLTMAGQATMLLHALLMPLGIFPLFMFGFIFTAGPRWLASPVTHPHLPVALAYLLGLVLALAGLRYGPRAALPGMLLLAASWCLPLYHWWRCIRASRAPDRRHAWGVLVSMLGGWCGLLAGCAWMAGAPATWWSAARALMLWGWLLPLFLSVSHRMLPFFTQSALQTSTWRPDRLLDAWWLGCAVLLVTDLAGWSWLHAAAAAALALNFAYTSWRWGLTASLPIRLLAMLHLAFAWLTLALALEAAAAFGLSVGSAPAHALALGFCCTMLYAFVTRVSLGHSGRPLQSDGAFWLLYLGMQLIALLRVGAALVQLALPWLQLLAFAWLMLWLVWAARVLPMYWRRRVDGQPG